MKKSNLKQLTWLHLGAGLFHRAHQAWFLNNLHQSGDLRWTLALGNIRNSSSQKALQTLSEQGGRYTLELISPEGERRYETITAISKIILWDPGIRALIKEGASADTRIISFTVTEGGYFLDSTGHLDIGHPDVVADLSGDDDPRTLYGALIRILRRRLETGAGPVTLLSCDNLSHNGEALLAGLNAFARASGEPALLKWIGENVSAPNSMVDRITPKLDGDLLARLAQQRITGDRTPVSCESFAQWVIEDRFAAGRPALEQVGVEFTADVTPFEEAKIRVLNASHSGVAWAGALAGKEFIDESLHPQVISWMRNYVMTDVIRTLAVTDAALQKYWETTLARFGNRQVRDTTERVCSDSLAKVKQYILPVIRILYERGEKPQATLILPALWLRFMQSRHEQTLSFDYSDRSLDEVNFTAIFTAPDPLLAFTKNDKIWGPLAGRRDLYEDLKEAMRSVNDGLSQMAGH